MTGTGNDDHWLVRPGSIRVLWIVFIGVLAATVAPDFIIDQHEDFGVEGSFGFYAWYGFVTCVGMIVVSKVLSIFLKRRDTYFDG